MSIPVSHRNMYVREDEFVILHADDEDLDTIKIRLPKLDEWYTKQLGRKVDYEEALTYVDGYGLHPHEQKFQHQKWPDRLKIIHEVVFRKKRNSPERAKYKDITDVDQEDLYEEIESNQLHYEHEILWIKKQIKRRYVGYWCFINGKPTYINGAFYFFLNFWKLKNKNRSDSLPDYRNYQREMFTLYMYCFTTHEAFYKHRVKYMNEEAVVKEKHFNDLDALKDFVRDLKLRGLEYLTERHKKGGFVVEKEGERTINGVNFISGRRVAKTDSACCFCYWGTTNLPEQLFIIQGLNKDQAVDKVFVEKIQKPFHKLPFFFRPYVKGREEARAGLKFTYDGNMAIANRAGAVADPLNSRIVPLSSNERAADGEEVNFAYIDEPGKELDKKSQERDIPSLWYTVLKPTTEIGDEIVGFCIMPTTVGDMDTGGGAQFLDIVNDSHFGDRNDNGTTQSGLVNFFMSGYYAIPGNFIDEYGNTIIETPKEPVMSITGKLIKIGAKEYHENYSNKLRQEKKFDKLTTHLQNFPPSFREAFSMNMKGMGLTAETMERMKIRLSDLQFAKKKTTAKIDFVFYPDTEDVFTDVHGMGLWTYSYLPPKDLWNRKTQVTEDDGYTRLGTKGPIWAPHTSVANKFIIAFDPVAFDKMNKKGKGSIPAATVFYKRDKNVDPDTKPREEWVSQDYVAFIRHRSDRKEEIYEEVLKAAILYGAYIYPEVNAGDDFLTWVRKRGYDGYLLKDMDEKGNLDKRPGVWADNNTIADMVLKMADFFSNNVRYMKIPEIIEDWLKMKGVDDLTNHDLAAASGWCQRADAQRTGDVLMDLYQPIEIESGFDTFAV